MHPISPIYCRNLTTLTPHPQTQMEDIDRRVKAALPFMDHLDLQLDDLELTEVKLGERADKVKAEITEFMDRYIDAIEKHRKSLLAQVTSRCVWVCLLKVIF